MVMKYVMSKFKYDQMISGVSWYVKLLFLHILGILTQIIMTNL